MMWRFKGVAVILSFLVSVVMLNGCSGPTTETPTPTPTGPETVTFPDKNLEAAIRDALGKPPDEEITAAELAKLTKVDGSAQQITDLSGLEYCTNLTELYFSYNQISDISPLSSLTNLVALVLDDNQIRDISPLSSLTNLEALFLHENRRTDISPLVENSGLGSYDIVRLEKNRLELWEGSKDMRNIRALADRGVYLIIEVPTQ